jgi:hypothetical protein
VVPPRGICRVAEPLLSAGAAPAGTTTSADIKTTATIIGMMIFRDRINNSLQK